MKHLIAITAVLINLAHLSGQNNSAIEWKGVVKNSIDQTLIPHATIASYSNVALYVANEEGKFILRLPKNDSIRVEAIGYQAETVNLQQAAKNSTGLITILLDPISYQIKEVTIKGYQGIIDPLIFQNHLPTKETL